MQFERWRGPQFGEGVLGSKRLLVLGESHYSEHPEEDARGSLTQEIIKDFRDDKRSDAYFRRVQALVAGAGGSDSEDRQLWNQIAFCNYIREFAGTHHDDRPKPELWEEARKPFLRLLDELKPDRVLVTGVEVWNDLDKALSGLWLSTKSPMDDGLFIWSSVRTGTQIRATWTNHPSWRRGWKPEHWLPRVKALLRD